MTYKSVAITDREDSRLKDILSSFDLLDLNFATETSLDILNIDADLIIIEEIKTINSINIINLLFELRKNFSGLIWVLSAKYEEKNEILYYKMGVDGISYSDRPSELIHLQLTNALKRNFKISTNSSTISKGKGPSLTLNPINSSVHKEDGQEISLTRSEYNVLNLLMENLDNTVTYEEMLSAIWNDDKRSNKYRISNLIFHLRSKVESDLKKPKYIKTVRSKGYRLKNS
ncbi:two-component system, OmpR family, response regulator VicR [Enterococcus sp. DIV0840]|uniref:winged helix-turn-helix domain-containing protein n=1 Tax=unclassified Enterococcus TaxID=2608891 RepID=UPI001A8FAC2A|nr:winged helix-turn-helix domain-containing protein [Enterococcus sp. DIV0849a]MBO0434003.1 response regulator transcription factor [Enterococcus sp. DIV0849a]